MIAGAASKRLDLAAARTDFEGQTLFIGDLHLHPSHPEQVGWACRFLEYAKGATALYILGDLFEYWLGDDTYDPTLDRVIAALKTLSASGTALHLMHGNRDFLLGEQFATSTGAQLHTQDSLRVVLGGERVLVMHGDTLCTDDIEYQSLRRQLRDPDWQAAFLALPAHDREREADTLRQHSQRASAGKRAAIMDVNQRAVEAVLRFSGCRTLVHGHTHRPHEHRFVMHNRSCRRLVVGDWSAHSMIYAGYDGLGDASVGLTLRNWHDELVDSGPRKR